MSKRGETKGPASRLARLLKPYGIAPASLWIGAGNVRGYAAAAFADAWGRYLP